MKAVILAGGLGTRLSEETSTKPKPMVEIGGKPILWHIMKIYSAHGINDFIICCGYKGYMIKEYFTNYFNHQSDITIDLLQNKTIIHKKRAEPWKVTLIDTGEDSMTGGRLKRVSDYLIVGLQLDPSIDRPEKNGPSQSIIERYIQLKGSKHVDEIVPYVSEQDLEDILRSFKLDVRIIGDEYKEKNFTGRTYCAEKGIEIYYNSRDHRFSSSSLRKQVKSKETN